MHEWMFNYMLNSSLMKHKSHKERESEILKLSASQELTHRKEICIASRMYNNDDTWGGWLETDGLDVNES